MKAEDPYPQLTGSPESMGVCISKSRSYAEAGHFVSQRKEPHPSVIVRIPNSWGHTKAWELFSLIIGDWHTLVCPV